MPTLALHPVAQAEIEAVRPALEALCARYNVERLWIFGSATGAEFDPERSDFDLLIERGPAPEGMNDFRQLTGFLVSVEALFPREVQVTDWTNRTIVQNPYFQRNVETSRQVLYAV